jgi:hypothetical protein
MNRLETTIYSTLNQLRVDSNGVHMGGSSTFQERFLRPMPPTTPRFRLEPAKIKGFLLK